MMKPEAQYSVELPICRATYEMLYEGRDARHMLEGLFQRSLKKEF